MARRRNRRKQDEAGDEASNAQGAEQSQDQEGASDDSTGGEAPEADADAAGASNGSATEDAQATGAEVATPTEESATDSDAAEDDEGNAVTATVPVATEDSGSEQPTSGTAHLEFDAAKSARILSSCASIMATASTSVDEAAAAAAPFLSFGQKARIRGMATDFEVRRVGLGSPAPAAAAPQATRLVDGGHGLTEADVERIVGHRVDLAVRQVLQSFGLSPEQSFEAQVDTVVQARQGELFGAIDERVQAALSGIEGRLEDRLTQTISELLDADDGTVDDEELDEAVTRAEVEEKIEEAREQLLKNIDEVREVDLGFNIGDFTADIAEMVSTNSSDSIASVADADIADAVELGGEALELGGDEEIELGGDVGEIELGGDDEAAGTSADGSEGASPGADATEAEAAEFELESDAGDVELDLDGELEQEGGLMAAGDGDSHFDAADLAAAVGFVDLPMEAVEVEVGGEVGSGVYAPPDDDGEEDDQPVVDITPDDAVEELGEAELEDLSVLEPIAEDVAPAEGDSEIELSEEDPDSAIETYLHRAAEMRARKQAPVAMQLYSKVLDIDEENYEAHIGLGVLHLEAKDYKEASNEFQIAERIDASRPAAALGLAEVYFHRKQFNKAIRHYTQCLKLDDSLAQAYCNRGLSHYYQKNHKKAFLDLMRAYDIDSDLPNIKKYLKLVRNKVRSEG